MLFNSSIFIFLFLPISFAAFFMCKKLGYGKLALAFVALSSLIFYGWWDASYLLLLMASIVINYGLSRMIVRSHRKGGWLAVGVMGNLLCLAYFKYIDFFISNINSLADSALPVQNIVLPLGISFFTFQQIAYLVDTRKGQTDEHNFLHYLVFVTFFAQLIAGPIVHHKQMMSQFVNHHKNAYDWKKAALGIAMFAIGLFKKTLIADELSPYVIPIFDVADQGQTIAFVEAWTAALSYSFQIYFDFSGYSDMAIGLGLLFGVRLPANFLSPYKAKNIIEFWRCWHITLSQFLRDYLYFPLGGNRKGTVRRYINLMMTMLLGGLWHGAGWTFIIWGGLHGLYLIINHGWRALFKSTKGSSNKFMAVFSCSITMLAVVVAWVFFRATNLSGALNIISGMIGLNGFDMQDVKEVEHSLNVWPIIIISAIIVWACPNSLEIIAHAEGVSDRKRYSWMPNKKWVMFIAMLLFLSLYFIVYRSNHISEYIYFKF